MDFANSCIGGGVLTGGRVQEEIRFCICPELLVSLLIMDEMDNNEAIVVSVSGMGGRGGGGSPCRVFSVLLYISDITGV